MILLKLAFLLCASQTIDIPDETTLAGVSKIAKFPKGWALLDTRSPKLVTLDLQGKLLATFNQKGPGPGEWQKPFGLRYFKGHFYVTDLLKRQVLVLSEDLKVIKELKVGSLCRDVLVTREGLYFVYWDPMKKAMVHQYSHQMEAKNSFGSGLSSQRSLGFQSGSLLGDDKHLYFIHHFIAQIEIFTSNGAPVRTIPIPGFEPKELVHFPRGQVKFKYSITNIFKKDQTIFFKFRNEREWKGTLHSFSFEKNSFGKPQSCPFETVADPLGAGFFEFHENSADDSMSLQEIKIEVSL